MPKGDGKLVASIGDGYTRIPNLLLEALAYAPLTASELRCLTFLIRRTYGWSRRTVKLMDTITKSDFALGTGLDDSTIKYALRKLRRENVVLQEQVAIGGALLWGINPDVGGWGRGHPWGAFHLRFNGLSLGEASTPRSVSCPPVKNTGERIDPQGNSLTHRGLEEHTPPGGYALTPLQALSPTGTGVPGVGKRTTYTKDKDKGGGHCTDCADASGDQRPETPIQRAISDAWEACCQDGKPSGEGYSGLVVLVQEKGLPFVGEWVEHLRGVMPEPPEGADPWKWFRGKFRDAMRRPWEWQGNGRVPHAGPVSNEDFGPVPEDVGM